MNTKDRYNRIIQTIEEKASDPYQESMDILQEVAEENCMSRRDMSIALNFLMGVLPLKYIKERKMMAAYRHLISLEDPNRPGKPDISGAIGISGKPDQSSFITSFKKLFFLTPTEAFKKKDDSLITPPLDWDRISCETEKSVVYEEEVENMERKSIFGITQEQYARIVEATELTEIYGLDEWKANIAFELAAGINRPLERTFCYISELDDFGFGIVDDEESAAVFCEEDFCCAVYNSQMQFLFFTCNISIAAAYDFINRFGFSEKELLSKDPRAIHAYAEEEEVSFEYLEKAVRYYDEHADKNYDEENFKEFLEEVCSDVPIETAFKRIIPSAEEDCDWDTGKIVHEEEEDWIDPYKEVLEEEMRWHGVRIDLERDPDNLSYDLDDFE